TVRTVAATHDPADARVNVQLLREHAPTHRRALAVAVAPIGDLVDRHAGGVGPGAQADRPAHAAYGRELVELGGIGLDSGVQESLTGDRAAIRVLVQVLRFELALGLVAGGKLRRLIGDLRSAVGERAAGKGNEQSECGEERDAIRSCHGLMVTLRYRCILRLQPCDATDDGIYARTGSAEVV